MSGKFKFDRPERRIEKLSDEKQEDLLFDLLKAFEVIGNNEEAALFVQDLLTKQEVKIFSKRLRIAKLLLAGKTYKEVEYKLHTSHGTVAKIAVWLAERGEGFRKILAKIPKRRESEVASWAELGEWGNFKRRYPIYFWPELLLEEIVVNAGKREKDRLRNVLARLKYKSKLHQQIEKLLGKGYPIKKYSAT